MVFIGVDGWQWVGLTTLAVPCQLVTIDITDDIAQLAHFGLKCFDTVGLFDFQGLKPLEMEGDAHNGTRHNESLGKVGTVQKIVFQTGHAVRTFTQGDGGGLARYFRFEEGLYAQQAEDIAHAGVALFRTVHQSFEPHFGIGILREEHHLIPIGGGTPVVLDEVGALHIGLGTHGDSVTRGPFGIGPELAHGPKREVNVGAGDDVAG